jgi:hypothetical protein
LPSRRAVASDRRPIDAQQSAGSGAQEAPVGGLPAQAAGELFSLGRRTIIRAGDRGPELLEDLASDRSVASRLVGVAADHEAVAHGASSLTVAATAPPGFDSVSCGDA